MLKLLQLSALSWVTQVTAQIWFKEKRETSDQSGAQDMTKSLRSNTPKMLQRAYMLASCTHLLSTIIANSDVECILRAKTLLQLT